MRATVGIIIVVIIVAIAILFVFAHRRMARSYGIVQLSTSNARNAGRSSIMPGFPAYRLLPSAWATRGISGAPFARNGQCSISGIPGLPPKHIIATSGSAPANTLVQIASLGCRYSETSPCGALGRSVMADCRSGYPSRNRLNVQHHASQVSAICIST